MFGRQTQKQLAQALEVIAASIKVAQELAEKVEHTERLQSEAMALVSKSQANADAWQGLCEAAQHKPDDAPAASVLELNPPHCRWVN
jgi:hypothetical protein